MIEFLAGDFSVAVFVQRADNRRHEGPSYARAVTGIGWCAFAAIIGGAVGLLAVFPWRGIGRLRGRKARRQGERKREEDCLGFHGLVFLVLLFGLRL